MVRWTSLLGEDGWDIVSADENGRCIPRTDDEITAVVQGLRRSGEEALVVMLGSNDLLRQRVPDAGVCAKRMEAFLAALLAQASKPLNILLVAPPPWNRGPGCRTLHWFKNPAA